MTKFSSRRGSSLTISGSLKIGLVSGVDRMFKSSDSAFYHNNDRLNPLRKSVEFDNYLYIFASYFDLTSPTCTFG